MKRSITLVLASLLALIFITPAHGENRGALTKIVVPSSANHVVIDVMDGVEARYRTMSHPDFYGEYSCAGYVKAYYAAVYGVFVDNLDILGPPRGRYLSEGNVPSRNDVLVRVDTPQKGDIIFYTTPPHRNNHSAIVKSFDGRLITLIEQNYKWAQDGGTFTWLNRTVAYSLGNNPYQIWRLSGATVDNSPPTPDPGFEQEPGPTHPPEATPAPTPTPVPEGASAFMDDNPIIYEVVFGGEGAAEAGWPETEWPDAVPEELEAEGPETVPVFLPQPEDETYHMREVVHITEVVVGIGSMVITVDGVSMPIDAPAYIENNLTMLPVRYVSYALGLNPENLFWDEPTRSVAIINRLDLIRFAIDSEWIFVNEQPRLMDCPAVIQEDFAYLPVRYLAEAMGVMFEWDPEEVAVRFSY